MAIQLISVEEFDALVRLPENRGRRYEYVGGRVVEVVSNNYSSVIGMFIGAMLTVFVHQHKLGYVTGADGGYRVAGERYIPDCAFISRPRQPEPSREACNSLAPDLAVEVLSPTDDERDMRMKVVNYLRAGTTVWLVDPDQQQVEVYAPDQPPAALGVEDKLDGGSLLPGFQLPIAEIFAQ